MAIQSSHDALLLLVSLHIVSCAPPATEESPAGFGIVSVSVLDGGGGAARSVNVHVEGDTIVAVGPPMASKSKSSMEQD